jgi:hypothetical protein
MTNPYEASKSELGSLDNESNNSGKKEKIYPEGIKGWSWGAFILNWIWAIGNKSYVGLLAFVPYVGFLVVIYLGFKGREMAWRNKRWESVEHFNRVQRKWSKWGAIIIVGTFVLGILASIMIPAYQDYVIRAQGL